MDAAVNDVFRVQKPNFTGLEIPNIGDFSENFIEQNLSANRVREIIKLTKLPVIAKGIMTAKGARIARNIGFKGIIVWSHGGRKLDLIRASIEALPEIVEAVGKDITVMMDSGIRSGTDVLKALIFWS